MADTLCLSFMGTQNSFDLSSCRTNTLCFSGSSAASKNFFFTVHNVHMLSFFLLFGYGSFFSFMLSLGTLSLRFARGCSLELGRLVSLKPLCLRRQEWKRLRERFAKESCGAVKGFPLGFPAPLPWSSPNCGRGEVRWVSTLSRAFLQLVPVRLFGTGQAAHIHEEKKRGAGVPWY